MPSRHCTVSFTVTPDGAGSRQVDIKYTVLFNNENNEVDEIQPITKKICTVWYDGIYPSIKVCFNCGYNFKMKIIQRSQGAKLDNSIVL